VNLQTLEQSIAQETSGGIKSGCGLFRLACDDAEKNFGMRIVGRDFHRIDGHHAHPRVFEFAGDQARQITLDLIGHPKTTVGQR